MKMKDVIKNSVLNMFESGALSTTTVAFTLGLSGLMGLCIYALYRLMAKDAFYSRSFNKTLALLPMITASVVLAMQSNLVVSLGMVGALSIVRFRTAVKNPLDLAFLFFSISMGILFGAQLLELAVVLALAYACLLFLLDMIPALRAPCLLVIETSAARADDGVLRILRRYAGHIRLRNRSISGDEMELIFELRVRDEANLMRELAALEGVACANLLSHDGELRV